jgi:peptide-methionine (S)-S-oxide reductase
VHRFAFLIIGACLVLALAFPARVGAGVVASSSSTAPAAADTALFAGGCFWCMETAFEGRPGIRAAVSGYSGGHKSNPTYEEVGAHTTGHLETVAVVYDAKRISYEQLLDLFWHSIDPTQGDGQFCDRGESYRSAIFWRTEAQRRAALASKQAIEKSGALRGRPIVTTIAKAGPFWPAEDYHQDFYRKDAKRYHEYREGCGRDRRLQVLWGDRAVKPSVH